MEKKLGGTENRPPYHPNFLFDTRFFFFGDKKQFTLVNQYSLNFFFDERERRAPPTFTNAPVERLWRRFLRTDLNWPCEGAPWKPVNKKYVKNYSLIFHRLLLFFFVERLEWGLRHPTPLWFCLGRRLLGWTGEQELSTATRSLVKIIGSAISKNEIDYKLGWKIRESVLKYFIFKKEWDGEVG